MSSSDAGPPWFHERGFKEDIDLLRQGADQRNAPLAMQLLLRRLYEDFGSFRDGAFHVARFSGRDTASSGALEVADYPGGESGIGDLRIWLVRGEAGYGVIGIARGSGTEVLAGRAPEMYGMTGRLRDCFGPVDTIFDGVLIA